MHEITLCQRALELIEQQAVQNHAKRVTGVRSTSRCCHRRYSAVRSARAAGCASWRMTVCRSNASKSRRSNVCVVPAVALKATCI